MDLTEAEEIKKRWQEYTEELYKKDLHVLSGPVPWRWGRGGGWQFAVMALAAACLPEFSL